MDKEDKEILRGGCVLFVLIVVLSLLLTLFWGWVLQLVLYWFGLVIPYYVAVLAVLLLGYISNLFKK